MEYKFPLGITKERMHQIIYENNNATYSEICKYVKEPDFTKKYKWQKKKDLFSIIIYT